MARLPRYVIPGQPQHIVQRVAEARADAEYRSYDREEEYAADRYALELLARLPQGKKAAAGAELRQAVAPAPNLPQRAKIDKLLDKLPR